LLTSSATTSSMSSVVRLERAWSADQCRANRRACVSARSFGASRTTSTYNAPLLDAERGLPAVAASKRIFLRESTIGGRPWVRPTRTPATAEVVCDVGTSGIHSSHAGGGNAVRRAGGSRVTAATIEEELKFRVRDTFA